jgi:Phosphotransferase enzyme family
MTRVMDACNRNGALVDTDEEDLRQSVELVLARVRGSDSPITRIRRRGFGGSTSYPSAIVTVDLSNGDSVVIFLKDFAQSRLSQEAAAERRERELHVYEDLLDGEQLGTARFYGAQWDDASARFWLMLEFVEGELLRDCGFEYWPAAAAWLGRLHGRFAGQGARLRGCRFLVRHDADFFVRAAEHALTALSDLSTPLARRLAAVLARYEPVLAILNRDPETLVHGSYRKQNVLVGRSSEPTRICPTDWELAAFGRSAYDLAFVCDDLRSPKLDALFDAYEREVESSGLSAPDREELRHEVECFCLQKKINSLGRVRRWPRPFETASKVMTAVEELAGRLA